MNFDRCSRFYQQLQITTTVTLHCYILRNPGWAVRGQTWYQSQVISHTEVKQ